MILAIGILKDLQAKIEMFEGYRISFDKMVLFTEEIHDHSRTMYNIFVTSSFKKNFDLDFDDLGNIALMKITNVYVYSVASVFL